VADALSASSTYLTHSSLSSSLDLWAGPGFAEPSVLWSVPTATAASASGVAPLPIPLAAAGADVSLLQLGLAFVAVALAGAVAERLDVSVIPLYVVAGILVGEFGLGTLSWLSVGGSSPAALAVPDGGTMLLLAELGIVLLLFFLGLEFSVDRLVASRREMSRAGFVDAVVNFPVGVGVGLLLGWTAVEAALLGGIVYISSSAIITKSMLDLGWIANDESEPILGTLVFEDLVIAGYLAVVTPLVVGATGAGETVRNVAVALGVLAVLAAIAFYGAGVLERALRADSNEVLVLRALAVSVPVAGAALALGVSEAVAAFFIGATVAGTTHVEDVERLLSPVRDVFAAVFFLWIGLQTDPSLLVDPAVLGPLAALVVLSTPTKLASGFYGGRAYGLTDKRSLRVGLAMVTRGEFSLVIAALAATGSGGPVMTAVIPAVAVGYVLVMSTVGTLGMQFATSVERIVPGLAN
jgi:CPA2 family monovalent cation:H+ antiporter-2